MQSEAISLWPLNPGFCARLHDWAINETPVALQIIKSYSQYLIKFLHSNLTAGDGKLHVASGDHLYTLFIGYARHRQMAKILCDTTAIKCSLIWNTHVPHIKTLRGHALCIALKLASTGQAAPIKDPLLLATHSWDPNGPRGTRDSILLKIYLLQTADIHMLVFSLSNPLLGSRIPLFHPTLLYWQCDFQASARQSPVAAGNHDQY
jgi:hypothetical protein